LNVFFVPLNVDAAGCYRCIFPCVELGRQGHRAGLPAYQILDQNGQPVPLGGEGLLSFPQGNLNLQSILPEDVWDYDTFVLQMPTARHTHDLAVELKARGKRVLVDLDDHLHLIPEYNAARLSPAENPDVNNHWALETVKMADGLSVATPALERYYRTWNSDIRVIPNLLWWPMWEHVPPAYEGTWRRFRVGYMGSVDYHSEDLLTLGSAIHDWMVAHPDSEFVACADERIHDILDIPEAQRVTTSATAFRCLDLGYITAAMDVGLVPLVRNEFNEAKSCLKGMEYAACGIPCLATPTGEYRRWVGPNDNGLLCKYPGEYINALDYLYENPLLLKRMGRQARQDARRYSIDRNIELWEDWLAGDSRHADAAGTLTAA
jgi:glycosyltransferase involved in cell wall biosynthesis